MIWTISSLRRFRNPVRRRPIRPVSRTSLERLEVRIAPANIAVLSGHYDGFLSGANTQETVLTPANVNSTSFGNLFNYAVDGYVYAQPLYVPNLTIAGGTHNVVFAATEHDSVYAFDADGGGQLWQRSFINPAGGVTTVPQPDVISGDIVPEIGITGTPVISGNTMFVVVKTKEMVGGVAHYVQRLHALDIATGLNRATNGVVTLGDTTIGGPDGGYTDVTNIAVPGTGVGSDGTTVRFNALRESQRAALTIANGVVYIAWASHGDNGPYHGWVVGYAASDLSLQKFFNTSPNGNASGIWESGGGLGVDAQFNLYFATGNGFFEAGRPGFDPSIGSYSESVLKLSSTGQLSVADYFTPTDWQTLDDQDADLGSGGTMLLPDAVGSAAHPHLIVETGKTGRMYLIDRDNMGKNNTPGPDLNLQTVTLGGPGVWGNPAFFLDQPGTGAPGTGSGLIYYWGTSAPAVAFRVTNGVVSSTPFTQTNFAIGFPGGQPSISANGADPNSAIMWALRVDNFGQKGPAELMAFRAEDLSQELYSSNGTSFRDQFGSSVKFTYPIVTNGHVYAGSNGFLAVFGLFPTPTAAPAAPSNLAATPLAGGTQVKLTWTNNYTAASPAAGNRIYRSQDGVNFQPIATVSRTATTFTDTGLTPATLYYYRVVATNQVGDSPPSNTASVRTRIASPVLSIADVCVGAIDLSWTGTANNHYDIKRSTNGTTFTLIATVPASQTTFIDTGLANGTYYYQVTAVSNFPEGNQTGDSNVAKATIGPITIVHGDPTSGNPGFADHSDLLANGSAQFTTENLLRLNNNFGQAGSAFEVQRVGIRGFTTSFQVRLHEGTQPNPADGFTFTIQANSPTALGGGGGSLGYQGITNSITIKFDVYDNEGETTNSTGLFFNGDFPGLPHAAGEVNFALNPANVNLRSQSTKTITLTYNGSTLTETIHDPTPGQTNNGDFTATYTLDIAGRIGADTAFVGFTGGTGGLFSLQDVLNWRYAEQEANLPPRAPGDLRVTSIVPRDVNRSDVNLTWNCNNAYTAQNFVVERSTDGLNFTTIATLPTTVMTFTDSRLGAGAYYYRVRSTNAQGSSRPSNTVTAEIRVPMAPLNLRLLNVFAQHIEIAWDPNSTNQTGFRIERSSDGVHFTTIGQVDAYTTTFIDVRPSATVFYRVEALSPSGLPGLPSNVLEVDPVGQFISQDIGDVALPGSATFDNRSGTYAVNASGSDIWDVSDSFHYIYQPLSGDGEIVARVVDVAQTDFWAKAGVMIRESFDPGARNAFMLETPPGHDEPVFQWRTDTGGGTADSDNHIAVVAPAPIWLRVVRVGDSFTGYYALDKGGSGKKHGEWIQMGGTVNVDMGANVYVGLALTAHNNGSLNTSHFTQVQVTQYGATQLGAPTNLNVLHVFPFKSAAEAILAWQPGSDNETGFRIERSTDGVNFSLVATLGAGATSYIDTNGAKGLAAGTYYYRVKAFANGLPDSPYSNTDSVRFALPGQTLTISHGFENDNDFTANGSAEIFPNPAPTGTFSGHQDIGGVAAAGAATFQNGTYSVQASGSDIWDVSDSFHYVYKPLVGDGEIVARVVGIDQTDYWAKAGVMIRAGLAADAKNAFMLETPNVFGHNEPVFQWRTNTADFTNGAGAGYGTQAAPIWLRLVRSGSFFTGYWAADINNGQSHGAWNQVGGSVQVDMGSQVYVGLALTAHNNSGVLNTSTFDHVSITGATAPLPPSVAELTDGNFGEAGSIFLSNRVGVTNFNTAFTFRMTPGTVPMADGMAFVMQGVGPTALGPPGGGLGYGSDFAGGRLGLPHSVMIKFDIYDNSGEGNNSTGIFTNGRSPTVRLAGLSLDFPDTSISLDGTGINLSSGHPFAVTLTYDGAMLTETITDTVTNASKTLTYSVNIPALIGSDVAYVGFTGGTGGLTTVADVLSWTLQTTLPNRQPQLASSEFSPMPAGAPPLTADQLAPVAQQAIALWAMSGLSPDQIAQLQAVKFEIAPLRGGALGLTTLGSSVVTLDSKAAGYGWFADPTPVDDSEFAVAGSPGEWLAQPASPAFGRMDLLTVVEHELGHVLGLEDLDPQVAPHDLMSESLAPGVRRGVAGAFAVPLPALETPTAPATRAKDRGAFSNDFAIMLPGVKLLEDAGPVARIGDDRGDGGRGFIGLPLADLSRAVDRFVASPPEVSGAVSWKAVPLDPTADVPEDITGNPDRWQFA